MHSDISKKINLKLIVIEKQDLKIKISGLVFLKKNKSNNLVLCRN